jgi:hypothetical protein
MNDDARLEKMIQDGTALDALAWLTADPERRRIGESIFLHPNHSLEHLSRRLRTGLAKGVWICDIEKDADGNEYAGSEIYELPDGKTKRKTLFRGLAIRFALSKLTPLVDIGQKYVFCPRPSAAQVDEVDKMLGGE